MMYKLMCTVCTIVAIGGLLLAGSSGQWMPFANFAGVAVLIAAVFVYMKYIKRD